MTKKVEESAQTILMQRLKEALPPNLSLVDELADLLQVSNDSAYRRMRGETALSIEDIAAICKHFKLSFDAFLNSSDNGLVTFSYHQLGSHVNSYKEYLQNISNDLEKMLKFEDRQIVYAAEDIPVFHHFCLPELAAFKIFYWNKSILNSKGYEELRFDKNLVNDELVEIAQGVLDRYNKIPSIEIWSDDTINSTVKQIEFYWDAGFFSNKEDALLICDQVYQMLERIKKQAELNVKLDRNNLPIPESNYALYHSDVMIGNNCILVNMGATKATYISYHTFNVMLTTNANYSNETDLWLKNLIRKSNLISGVAEKQRYQYFKRVESVIKKLRDKIEND
ncbi:MAG: helix-turn-helix domain-containing protein [Bacteroidota bacterium]